MQKRLSYEAREYLDKRNVLKYWKIPVIFLKNTNQNASQSLSSKEMNLKDHDMLYNVRNIIINLTRIFYSDLSISDLKDAVKNSR